jgi:transposase
MQQKELFMKLLYDLCQSIPEEPKRTGKGRPRMQLRDMVFTSALKVFTTFSLRRATTDTKNAQELSYTERSPHYSTVALYMENPILTPILNELIALSASPLKSVETKFAVDSSGFRTTKFNDYCRERHETKQKHEWMKVHICCGVKTNIITAVEVGREHHSADSPQFIPLTQRTHESGFKIEEVTGDKAYNSKDNYNAIRELGGVAYIPFKSNASPWSSSSSKGNRSKLWRRMLNYFTYNREEFMEHYHLRSNVETTFFMIKSKFTDLVRSRTETARINEVLLKVLCHNICVLIHESFELGISTDFFNDRGE